MREILFRAKSKLHGDFVYGNYADGVIFQNFSNMGFEKLKAECWSPIDVDTLGQYTGLTDKNGNKIFEGDKVIYDMDEFGHIGFCGGQFCFVSNNDGSQSGLLWEDASDEFEIIGNIHDKD